MCTLVRIPSAQNIRRVSRHSTCQSCLADAFTDHVVAYDACAARVPEPNLTSSRRLRRDPRPSCSQDRVFDSHVFSAASRANEYECTACSPARVIARLSI
ncbi:hypothetical protein X777_06261 [Ooceraea biroi]|uniref:Uncharacterized protein n=1 Tax=Ooceraea biroi TaxID=2015173 RepID=A0A026WAR5_OOCBI|nr:hypothetical protein X777_06261 [Ooceraea biroi]